MAHVLEAQYNWPVPAGTTLDRTSERLNAWIFAQYLNDSIQLFLDDQLLDITPGCFLIVLPNTSHRYTCKQMLRHNWMHLEGDVDQLLQRYQLEANKIYVPHEPEILSSLFRTLSLTHHGRGRFRQEYMDLKAEEILASLAMQLDLSPDIREMSRDRINMLHELRSELLEHPEQNWSVDRMAQRLYLSESFFYVIYKQCFGVSPAHDLQMIRIERACYLLRDGISVTETSSLCGFSNISNFIRQFKKVMGVTPTAYQK